MIILFSDLNYHITDPILYDIDGLLQNKNVTKNKILLENMLC